MTSFTFISHNSKLYSCITFRRHIVHYTSGWCIIDCSTSCGRWSGILLFYPFDRASFNITVPVTLCHFSTGDTISKRSISHNNRPGCTLLCLRQGRAGTIALIGAATSSDWRVQTVGLLNKVLLRDLTNMYDYVNYVCTHHIYVHKKSLTEILLSTSIHILIPSENNLHISEILKILNNFLLFFS